MVCSAGENSELHLLHKTTIKEMTDIMASMGQSMSYPWNCRKHSEEVSISWVQTRAVRVLEQTKRPETKAEDEQYTEGKQTCTEVSNLPFSILMIRRQHITTKHQDWTIFTWNIHSKTVWTLHWYYAVQWY